MCNIIKIAPGDTVLFTIGNDVDSNEYRNIHQQFSEVLNTSHIILMPEYAIKDITVFKRELTGTSNMFLNGGFVDEQSIF